jgi:cytochrome P450
MTTVADTWGVSPQQFWLRGEHPEQPVTFDRKLGMWNVYGYPEAVELLSEPKIFSSNTARLLPAMQDLTEGTLTQLDPPEHNKLRKLVSHAFTPKVVAGLENRIAALTHELLDEVSGRRCMELVADLAYPLPVIVIAELLGVPSGDRHLFKQWVDALFANTQQFSMNDSAGEQETVLAESRERIRPLLDYLADHTAQRRRAPREDLLTKLVEAEVDGHRLSDGEVVNFANVLLIAGHITTTMLLGNTVLCLDANPVQLARVRADRSLVPHAIEESLRFLSPFAVLGRVTNEAVELGGRRIPADQLLMVWIAAANRDARQFPDPDVFDITRDPNPQIGFGRGIHFCLGAPLARLEGRVAMNILLDRFPALRTDPEQPPVFIPSPNMTGVRSLPMLTG